MSDSLAGFDDFKKHIEKLQENVKALEGQHTIPFDELFPAAFMSNYTDSSSIEELLQKGNFDIKSQEDFETIPGDTMNSFIEVGLGS
jgi:hypothetical protein